MRLGFVSVVRSRLRGFRGLLVRLRVQPDREGPTGRRRLHLDLCGALRPRRVRVSASEREPVPTSTRRGAAADVAWPKNGDVTTPLKFSALMWFSGCTPARRAPRRSACFCRRPAAHAAERIGVVAAHDADLRPRPAAPPGRRTPMLQLRRSPRSTCARPRPLLRVTPAGRSLLTVSPLSSRPVVML